MKNLEDILKLTINDFQFLNYQLNSKIKAELFSGLKK